MELGIAEHVVRSFNWKLLVENYSENFHTPFVHPQLEGAAWDYIIDVEGPVVLATDRIKPGREHIAEAQADEPFLSGQYFTVFPNLMVSVFPRYFHALIVTPVDARTSRVDYHRYWTAERRRVPPQDRPRSRSRGRRAGSRDLRAACSAATTEGSTRVAASRREHEKGVAHVHQLLLRALADSVW